MNELDLYLDGDFCGVVTQSTSGNLQFEYDADYRARADATPLSLSMPLSAERHKKRAILPFLQGLLPDNPVALNAMARRFTVSANNPFALLTFIGSDVAGAVQLVPRGSRASDATLPRSSVRALTETEVGRMLRQVVSEYSDGVPIGESGGRFSLAGAQPKIALHRGSRGSWSIPLDATPTTHILKPVAGDIRRIDVVEQLTMRAAALLGNVVAQSELATIDGVDVFVTQRYDRARTAGRWRRLHQEDLCQALGVSPQKKYQQRDGGPGLADIAALIRSVPRESDRAEIGRRMFRAVVFNVLAGCTDAHAKNFSLLLKGNTVALAPLYDLVSFAPYWDGVAPVSSAMSVGGAYSFERIGVADLLAEGKRFGVGAESAELVETMRAGMISAFEAAHAEVSTFGAGVRAIADDVLTGLARLPLLR